MRSGRDAALDELQSLACSGTLDRNTAISDVFVVGLLPEDKATWWYPLEGALRLRAPSTEKKIDPNAAVNYLEGKNHLESLELAEDGAPQRTNEEATAEPR